MYILCLRIQSRSKPTNQFICVYNDRNVIYSFEIICMYKFVNSSRPNQRHRNKYSRCVTLSYKPPKKCVRFQLILKRQKWKQCWVTGRRCCCSKIYPIFIATVFNMVIIVPVKATEQKLIHIAVDNIHSQARCCRSRLWFSFYSSFKEREFHYVFCFQLKKTITIIVNGYGYEEKIFILRCSIYILRT